MLTKKDISVIQSLLKPLAAAVGALDTKVSGLDTMVSGLDRRTSNLERSLGSHVKASKREHRKLQQSINRLVTVYEIDEAKTNTRLVKIERTLGFASA